MRLEDGYEKIRIARTGPNQDQVNRFLHWVEGQGFIVWNLDIDSRYEIDGISKNTQQEIMRWLESLGRTFKKPQGRPRSSAMSCATLECNSEREPGSIYCPACHQHRRAEQARLQPIAPRRWICGYHGCTREARRYSYCPEHQRNLR